MTQRNDLLEQFENEWQSGRAPALSSFLASLRSDLTAADRRAVEHELVAIDLWHRWQRGDSPELSPPAPDDLPPRPSLADYVRRLPELGPVDELPTHLIREEYRVRRLRGEPVTPTDFQARFAGRSDLLDELARVDREFADAPTAQLDGHGGSTPPPAARLAAKRPLDLPETIGRYHIEEEIARGGMGLVVRVWDEQFERPLALKVFAIKVHGILDTAARIALWTRFEHEARLTGQLQHPGVPPVQERGCLADGRPYFVMKLIKGHSLAALLRERADCSADLPRYISIFKSVCDTLAYAHSLNILHRDLKPDNIMVGAFGEVQVMDWGLAKVVRDTDRESVSSTDAESPSTRIIVRSGSGPVDLTSPLDVLGTPAYLPPEQARGEVERLDSRSDVFGLGGILCVMLTGQPPFASGTARGNQLLSMQNDLSEAFARLDACGADEGLIDLAKRCLAPDMSHRPRDASVVAQAIADHTQRAAERWRRAEAEREAAQVQAVEERKRRRWTTALASVALLAMLLAGVSYRWAEQMKEKEIQKTAEGIDQRLRRASSFQLRGTLALGGDDWDAIWGQAFAELSAAETLAAEASAKHLRQRVEEFATTFRASASSLARDHNMLLALAAAREKRGLIASDDYLKTSSQSIIVFGHTGGEAYAACFRKYGIDVLKLPAERAADLIRSNQRIRVDLIDALDDWLGLDVERPTAERLVAIAQRADPDEFRSRLRRAVMEGDRTTLVSLAALAVDRELPVRTALLLADGLHLSGELGEAVRLLRRAQRTHPNDFWINDILGVYLLNEDPRQADEAGQCFAAAIALRPDAYFVYDNLAATLVGRARWREAIEAYDTAIRLNPDFLKAYVGKSQALLGQGDPEAAISACEEALRRDSDFVLALWQLATLQAQSGATREALALARQLVERAPTWPHSHVALGGALWWSGQHEEALRAYQNAVSLNANILDAQLGIADAHLARGNVEEARRGLDMAVDRFPHHAAVHLRLASFEASQGNTQEAVRAGRRAVALQPWFWLNYTLLAQYCYMHGAADEARSALHEALRLEPGSAHVHYRVGSTLQVNHAHDEAIEVLQRALEFNPQQSNWHLQVGQSCYLSGRYTEAAEHYSLALEADPHNAAAHYYLGVVYKELGETDACREALDNAIRQSPRDATYHWYLAHVLAEMGDVPAAIETLRRASETFEAGSQARSLLESQLQDLEGIQEFQSQLPEILAGKHDGEEFADCMTFARVCRYARHYAAATKWYELALSQGAEAAKANFSASDWLRLAQVAMAAASGKGLDAVDAAERGDNRRRALTWLRKFVESNRVLLSDQSNYDANRYECQRALRQIKLHADFAGVRSSTWDQLSEDDRQDWEQFWTGVDVLLEQASQPLGNGRIEETSTPL